MELLQTLLAQRHRAGGAAPRHRRRRPDLPRELRRGGGRGGEGAAGGEARSSSPPPTGSWWTAPVARQLSVERAGGVPAEGRGRPGPGLEGPLTPWPRARAGVSRVHVIDGTVDEGLLAEVFSNEGIGTLVYANDYRQIRRAEEGRARLQQLIRASVESEELLPRSQAAIEKQLDDYYIFEVDRNPVACVALHVYPEQKQGRAGLPLRAALPREPGHRPAHGPVRRGAGARAGPRRPDRPLHPGLQLLPVQGRLRRGRARRPAAGAAGSATSRAAGDRRSWSRS